MNLQILRDATERPDLFKWAETIPVVILHAWLSERAISMQPDLFELLRRTGGGDFFETETILRPVDGKATADNADDMNAFHRTRGLSPDFWLFHVGLVLSAVRRSDGTLVVLSDGYSIVSTYATLDDWYIMVLRDEYANRYNLPPIRPIRR